MKPMTNSALEHFPQVCPSVQFEGSGGNSRAIIDLERPYFGFYWKNTAKRWGSYGDQSKDASLPARLLLFPLTFNMIRNGGGHAAD